jgi:hypothetical protein
MVDRGVDAPGAREGPRVRRDDPEEDVAAAGLEGLQRSRRRRDHAVEQGHVLRLAAARDDGGGGLLEREPMIRAR